MKSYINAIIIFNAEGEKRIVTFEPGVNIITGESKTGKSALVEIIDYCLCSSRSTVPKGEITRFAHIYALVMSINDQLYVIARPAGTSGSKMYFWQESDDFNYNSLELNSFGYDKRIPKPKNTVQNEIESVLGLHVSYIPQEDGQGKKASLRNMISYLFQHQNLMASKFALFYRFSDFYKRKDVIEQFPVFAGIIGQEYYSDLIKLEKKKTELKRLKNKKKANDKANASIQEKLSALLQIYYALIGKDFDRITSLKELIKIAEQLPKYELEMLFGDEKIAELYRELDSELNKTIDEERALVIQLNEIKESTETGSDYLSNLSQLKQQTEASPIRTNDYICPLCGQKCCELNDFDKELEKATNWLSCEVTLTKKHTDIFSESIRKLEEEIDVKRKAIKSFRSRLSAMKKKYLSSEELSTKKEKIYSAKAEIKVYLEMISTGVFESTDEEISRLSDEIDALSEKIDGFDVKTNMEKAKIFLSTNMNRLAKTLDFEEEYRPVNLNFELMDESFNLYHLQKNGSKIHLFEMGSGANWVSCHVALFLSFLRYFSKQEKSPMPLIMFFDQPSQVYFPQSDYMDQVDQKDLFAVSQLYKTIFDEINAIEKDTGILPQIIIVDHVDGNSLSIREEFNSYVRSVWRDGKALI